MGFYIGITSVKKDILHGLKESAFFTFFSKRAKNAYSLYLNIYIKKKERFGVHAKIIIV